MPFHILHARTNFIWEIYLHQYLVPLGSQNLFSDYPQETRIFGCITCTYRAIRYICILLLSVSHALKLYVCSKVLLFSICSHKTPDTAFDPHPESFQIHAHTFPLFRFLPRLPSHLLFLAEFISLSFGPHSKKSKLYCWCPVVNYKYSYFLDNICLSPVYTTGLCGIDSHTKKS